MAHHKIAIKTLKCNRGLSARHVGATVKPDDGVGAAPHLPPHPSQSGTARPTAERDGHARPSAGQEAQRGPGVRGFVRAVGRWRAVGQDGSPRRRGRIPVQSAEHAAADAAARGADARLRRASGAAGGHGGRASGRGRRRRRCHGRARRQRLYHDRRGDGLYLAIVKVLRPSLPTCSDKARWQLLLRGVAQAGRPRLYLRPGRIARAPDPRRRPAVVRGAPTKRGLRGGGWQSGRAAASQGVCPRGAHHGREPVRDGGKGKPRGPRDGVREILQRPL